MNPFVRLLPVAVALALVGAGAPAALGASASDVWAAKQPTAKASATPSKLQGGVAAIAVKEAWVREAPPTATMLAGYLTLNNPTTTPFKLVGVTSPQFNEVQMHEVVEVNGMSKMLEVGALDLPAKGELVFKPGATHLMLIQPKKPFKAGDVVELTLKWAIPKGATTLVKTTVKARGQEPSQHEHNH